MAKFKRIAIDSLPIGMVLRAPISDPNNPQIKLLTEGTDVNQAFIDKLVTRGIGEVVVSERDVAMMQAFRPQGRGKKVPPTHQYVQSVAVNAESKEIDRLVHDGNVLRLEDIGAPISGTLEPPQTSPYESGLQQQWAAESDEQVETLCELFDETCSGKDVSLEPLLEQCERIITRLKEDSDALVCLAVTPYPTEYPTRHAFHLASLAISIGVQVGLDHQSLLDLGVGCLIHDAGMRQVGLEQFESKTTLSSVGLQKLADHPVKALEVASHYSGISESARMVAYQVHERLDGSGYPRGRTANQIHDLAKIAAVADVFIGMATPPHRLGIQGYFAIKQILDEMKAGKFDPKVVRGLLQATSLYPIGSFVQLTNEHIGRVIRAGGTDYANPTIEMWKANQLDAEAAIVDLKEEAGIQIAASMPTPNAA